MGALVRRQLRQLRGLLVLMTVGLALFEVILIRVAAELEEGPGLTQVLGMLPGFVQDIITSYVADISFTTAVAVGFVDPASVVPSVALILLVTTTVAADRDTGALDLYLARPITRSAYLGASLVVAGLGALLMPAALLLGCVVGLAVTDGPEAPPWTHYIPSAVSLATLLLATAGVSLLVATGAGRRGTAVVRLVTGIIVAYVLEFLSFFWEPLQTVVWFSPFHYFKPIPVSLPNQWSWPANAAVLVGLGVVTAVWALRRFERQDV